MKKDPALEKIRKTRHDISQKFGHDTRALVAHYQALESKFADRLVRESEVAYSPKRPPSSRSATASNTASTRSAKNAG